MAAAYIDFDRTSPVGRQLARGLQMLKEARQVLRDTRAVLIQTRDGDGAQAAHYALTAAEVGYEQGGYASATAAAKLSFEELDSLVAKLNAGAGVGDATGAALEQCCAIHGVI